MEERRESGRRRPQPGDIVENFARFGRAAELQQGQRLLQAPVAQRRDVARRLGALEQRQRLGRALLLEEVGRQVEARADRFRRARDPLLQELLGRPPSRR